MTATADIAGCIAALADALGAASMLKDPDDCRRYARGARYGAGRAAFVVRPAATAEVAQAVRICATHGVALVPQGANTGLVGASTTDDSGMQAVLSLERMAAGFTLNPANRSATVSAGMRLSALNERLAAHRLWFPIDLGADPSVGGMLATNTGGTRFLRYGDVRRNVLGLEAVLWDGSVLDLTRALRKNNTGLDLRQLFIGTGGGFGIITRAVLELQPLPQATTAALVVPAASAAVPAILMALEADFGPQLTAFEGLSGDAMRCALTAFPTLRNPFAGGDLPDYALLVEVADWNPAEAGGQGLRTRLEEALERLFETGEVADARLHDEASFWSLRHHVSESLKTFGRVIALDLAVPRDRFVSFRDAARAAVTAMAPQVILADFGHVGDGATHFNMVWPVAHPYDAEAAEALRLAVCDIAMAEGGSFSAEHGIGPFNCHLRDRYIPEADRLLEARLRQVAGGEG